MMAMLSTIDAEEKMILQVVETEIQTEIDVSRETHILHKSYMKISAVIVESQLVIEAENSFSSTALTTW